MNTFNQSYFGKMRSMVGNQLLLMPAARIIIQRNDGKILFQHRSDFKTWGVPGGCAEPGERIDDVIIRETKEETGLTVTNPMAFGHSSDPKIELISYPQAGDAHFHVVLFYTHNYSGQLSLEDDETINLDWFDIANLPCMLPNMSKTIEAYIKFKATGSFQLI